MELARDAGVEVDTNGRALHSHCPRWGIEVLLARSDDIPAWAQDGAVEAAIAGRNQLVEPGSTSEELLASASALRAPGGRARRLRPRSPRPHTPRVAGSPPPTR